MFLNWVKKTECGNLRSPLNANEIYQTHQETFKVLVYLDIYGQVIISLMLVDKCIYSIVYLKS